MQEKNQNDRKKEEVGAQALDVLKEIQHLNETVPLLYLMIDKKGCPDHKNTNQLHCCHRPENIFAFSFSNFFQFLFYTLNFPLSSRDITL